VGLFDLFGFFSLFAKHEPPPPRGALAFVARATSGEQLEAEWPMRTFSVNEQAHARWDTQIRLLLVETVPSQASGKSVFRVKRSVIGYLPQKAVAAAQGRIRMHSAAPGALLTGSYYVCATVEGRVDGGSSAAFGY